MMTKSRPFRHAAGAGWVRQICTITIQADLRGQRRHNRPACGLMTRRRPQRPARKSTLRAMGEAPATAGHGPYRQAHTLDMMGNSQQLQVRSWPPQVARRFAKTIPFADGDKWYTISFPLRPRTERPCFAVSPAQKGAPDMDHRRIDDVPNLQGAGLFGQSNISEIYIDNVIVTPNSATTTAKK